MAELLAIKDDVKETKVMLGSVLNVLNKTNNNFFNAYDSHMETSTPIGHNLIDDIVDKVGLNHYYWNNRVSYTTKPY